MTAKLMGAYTKNSGSYPGYVNATRDGDTVTLIVRGDPIVRENSSFICALNHEKGQPGRCTPGDERCNNYCNLAPEKGAMQDSPKTCTRVIEADTVKVVFTAEEWALTISAITGAGK